MTEKNPVQPRRILFGTFQLLVNIGTFPYYRVFNFNTLQPIRLIALYSSQPEKHNKLLFHLDRWRTRKLAELQFVSIACAISAAAVIGSFSWNAVIDAYWLTSALWYSTLVLSILGLILSAQQVAVLQLLGPPPTSDRKADVRRFLPLMLCEVVHPTADRNPIGEWKPRWKMVFTWQCPTMFMAYAIICFLAGLTIFVCTPLIRAEGWNVGCNVAVVYLVIAGVAGAMFMFCAFWIYHYIDLDHGSEELNDAIPALKLSHF